MKRVRFFLLTSMILIGCGVSEIADPSVLDSFQFPRIIDPSNNDFLKLTSRQWLDQGEHPPRYFGNLEDEITLERNLSPTLAPPLPPGGDSSQWNVEPQAGKFDQYFVRRKRQHSYIHRDSANLLIKVDTTQIINSLGRKAFPVLVQNQSADTVYVGYGDEIPIVTEARNTDGTWAPIEKQFVYVCAVGLHAIVLPPDEIVMTSQLVYAGNYSTQLRIKLGNNYSNAFSGNINPTQFEWE